METRGKKSATVITDGWQYAIISAITEQSSRTKSYILELDHPWQYEAGQHCSLRLTAPDGYQATRDYSLSSSPRTSEYELTIALAPHGEVSGWFHEEAEVGDRIEVLGPIGRHFVWNETITRPVLLIGGGVGVTPLMSMLRDHRITRCKSPISLFYSARSFEDIIFKAELLNAPVRECESLSFTLVNDPPEGWAYHTGLVTKEMLAPLLAPEQVIYVCGPNAFVEAVDTILIHQLGADSSTIKTERFG